MNLSRRTLLQLAVGAIALPAVRRTAHALDYPARPVRIFVGFPPGLSPDVIARLVGQELSERLGQSVIVENRPGAGSNIAAETVVNAAPDGYTLLSAATSNAINSALYPDLKVDFLRDVAPVAIIATGGFVLAVNPSFSIKTLPEFIAYAKANPGKINMAATGKGTTPQLAGELFKMRTGIDWVHVPYRGGYLSDLLGAQVQAAFPAVASSIEYIRDGKLRALAVTSATRVDALPNIPTVAEFLPGYEASTWYGLVAPKNTSAEIIEKLNKEINAVVADPSIRARLVGLGLEPVSLTPADFGKIIADSTVKWAKVIRAANIRPD
jgi:tripartite-type tricarboxylate transporter receptor subunit TctC